MASLANNTIASTYPLLLKVDSNGIDGDLRTIEDGDGTDTALKVSTGAIQVDNIKVDGNTISSTDTNGNIVLSPNGSGTVTADVTGDVTGNCSGTAATVTGAAQSAITSVGVLTGLNINTDGGSTTETYKQVIDWRGAGTPSAFMLRLENSDGTNTPKLDFLLQDEKASANEIHSSLGLLFKTGGDPPTQALEIDSSQNVGIGAASEGHSFQITTSNANVMRLKRGSEYYDIQLTADGDLVFQHDGAADDVTFYRDGNVGIGNAAPTTKLQVKAGSTEEDVILLEDNSGTDIGAIKIHGGAFVMKGKSASAPIQLQTHDGNEDIEVDPDGFIRFETGGGERMRISAGGCIGINTTGTGDVGDLPGMVIEGGSSQTAIKFQVKDTDTAVDSNNVIGQLSFTADDNADSGKFFEFADSGGVIGSISANGAGNTAFNTSSDERLKKDIEDVSDSLLDEINKIKVRKFQWNHRPANFHIGLIAQELEKIIPKAVNKGGDDPKKKPYSVAYSNLVPYLIKAVQELSAKVIALENA